MPCAAYEVIEECDLDECIFYACDQNLISARIMTKSLVQLYTRGGATYLQKSQSCLKPRETANANGFMHMILKLRLKFRLFQ